MIGDVLTEFYIFPFGLFLGFFCASEIDWYFCRESARGRVVKASLMCRVPPFFFVLVFSARVFLNVVSDQFASFRSAFENSLPGVIQRAPPRPIDLYPSIEVRHRLRGISIPLFRGSVS